MGLKHFFFLSKHFKCFKTNSPYSKCSALSLKQKSAARYVEGKLAGMQHISSQMKRPFKRESLRYYNGH